MTDAKARVCLPLALQDMALSNPSRTSEGLIRSEVSRQGSTILIQLPGAKDQQQVLDVLGKTAELRFRPVLQDVGRVPTGDLVGDKWQRCRLLGCGVACIHSSWRLWCSVCKRLCAYLPIWRAHYWLQSLTQSGNGRGWR